MTLPRRDFLGIAGATGIFAVAGSPLHAGTSPSPADDSRMRPVAADWDMTWVDRITGRHRAVFDSPAASEGAALFRALMWINQYREVYGTARSDMSPVIILRHSGTALAMNDEYWTKFDIAKEIEKDENPPASADAPAGPAATPPAPRSNPLTGTGPYSLSTFQKEGGIVLVCNIAFGQAAGRFRKADQKLSREASVALAKTHLMPGAILQPSGVFAALRAQEAGCHYILAS